MDSPALRVLVVDDEELIRSAVGQGLARYGCEVSTAESGERALELIATTHPHLLLLDVVLPGIDGLTTLRRALALSPDLAVVMMSGQSSVPVAVEAMRLGAIDFLVKPFIFDTPPGVIERALAMAATRQQIVAYGHVESILDHLEGRSPAIAALREAVSRVAASDATAVLLEGESGVGKEVVAHTLHAESRRAGRPFLRINCSAQPEQLQESELFGHERGAFPGAEVERRGLFESAAGGTVLLDEVGDLSGSGQAKLLRLLEQRTFRRLGGLEELRADVRVIAATNLDLAQRIADGRFRADLSRRLKVVGLRVPPLRDHREDVPLLASFFIARYNHQLNREVRGVSLEALEVLEQHAWPGNVRELRNTIERAFILYPAMTELRAEHLPPELGEAAAEAWGPGSLAEPERAGLGAATEQGAGHHPHAAQALAITREALRYRLKKHGRL